MTRKAKKLLNLFLSLKTVIGTLSVSAYFMEHEKIAFWMLVGGAVLDGVIKYLNGEITLSNEKTSVKP